MRPSLTHTRSNSNSDLAHVYDAEFASSHVAAGSIQVVKQLSSPRMPAASHMQQAPTTIITATNQRKEMMMLPEELHTKQSLD